ncbi:arginyl-tRNA synthetase [Chlorobaculum parvum NCIB 8327]|uniref:Arginine--tRNA ligase n=1 Tax=Chlorobaculum parvum (strain DSM 263 / NCIMB 8327) TaxID=517417 RepID=SYR_CHLP8|nr:arginine--tRNA ligase [Chlorobaculum parvum]B3QLU7.1 RecName: Full=Arginine--tRNA ligase; AltName: Full=Arginyl-tRNA synthetase; Short=ArgRS [Chlorobaculum parvum NCIB 8327]ACF12433.1 arginyl-tRNA synthetase [Chlorobaculum parvum NCIB 8327]
MRAFFLPFIQDALHKAGIETDKEIQIDKPNDKKFGDFSTNIAFLLAKEARKNPRELATQLIGLFAFPEGTVTKTEVAGPGFINFHLAPAFFMRSAQEVLTQGEKFGCTESGKGQKAIVEYVSANPTGPLTIGRGRGGVLGDCIANLLETQGYEVTREYYFNDAGRQMQILAESVRYRYLEKCGQTVEFPETHYQGDYIGEIAGTLFIEHSDELASSDELGIFKETAEAVIFSSIRRTLERIGITHDSFFNEHTLYQWNEGEASGNQKVIDALEAKDFIGRYDGATWFMTTKLGQEKDKVLIKSSGDPSYRLPDIAYHVTKFERGFDLMVNVFGADHIDEYPDVLEALKILGYDASKVKIAINQFVTTTVGGQTVKMSTRKGNADLLDDLIEDVGADATRLFFIMRSKDSHLNFDVELAKKQSKDNPVFYLQYAHARICSLVRLAEKEVGFDEAAATGASLPLLDSEPEIDLASALLDFPDVIQSCLRLLEPQKMVEYLHTVAERYHKFYQECPILKADENIRTARLELSLTVRQVLRNGFRILGISAPESM